MSHHKIYLPLVKFANCVAIIGPSKIKSINKAKKYAKKTEGIISFYGKNVKTGKVSFQGRYDVIKIHACAKKNRVIKSLHRHTSDANPAKKLLSMLYTKKYVRFFSCRKN